MRINAVLLLVIVLALSGLTARGADFDLSAYQNVEYGIGSLPEDFFYPAFFKETESISYQNILAEIKFRFEFIAGVRPEPRQNHCYKMQKRIEKSLSRMQAALGRLPVQRIDEQLIFSEESPVAEYLKPTPRKATIRCSYHLVGDIASGGFVFCQYHGLADDSDYYKNNRASFERARPFFTSFEIVELLIFLPALIILPVTWFIMKRILEKN